MSPPQTDAWVRAEAITPIIGPARPRRVTLAVAVLTVLALLIGLAGSFALLAVVFWMLFWMAASGQASPDILIPGAFGVIAVAFGIVEFRAAMLVNRGDRWGRRLAVALALIGIAYGAWTVTGGAAGVAVPILHLGSMVMNGVVIVALAKADPWFDAVEAAQPAGARRSVGRRLAPWLAALGVFIVLVVASAANLRVSGDDRPTSYLAGLPETRLAYPGATTISSSSTPADAWFGTTRSATVTWRYDVPTTEEEITAWYAAELASRGWLRRDFSVSSGSVPVWYKDYASIELRSREAAPGVTRFTVTATAQRTREDLAPLRRLQAIPELGLVFPASLRQETGEGLGRRISEHNVQPARVVRRYDTDAAPADVLAFFDRELTARGWTALGPASERGERTWVRDDVEFALHAYSPETRDVNAYSFEITEVPGPDATPFDPWP